LDGSWAELLATVAVIVQRLFQAAVLILLPAAYLWLTITVTRLVVFPDYWQVTPPSRLAIISGLGVGLALVYASDLAPLYKMKPIFAEDGPWNLGVVDFLIERANPWLYSHRDTAALLANPDQNPKFTLAILMLSLLLAIATWFAVRAFQSWWMLIAILATFALAAAMVPLAIYLVALLAYSLHVFNFWSAAILIVITQYYRARQRQRATSAH
jgi:hypothetical protein